MQAVWRWRENAMARLNAQVEGMDVGEKGNATAQQAPASDARNIHRL
jgi:hypothetical protein